MRRVYWQWAWDPEARGKRAWVRLTNTERLETEWTTWKRVKQDSQGPCGPGFCVLERRH
jgi:hypothetical protein